MGIVGGTGYTGVELLRLLLAHPEVTLRVVTSRSDEGTPLARMFPSLRGHTDLLFTAPDMDRLIACDVVFFATPNGTAMQQVPELLAAKVRVIDLAADFRLRSPQVWSNWYGLPHACPQLLAKAVYGLPELYRDLIRGASLVANPGCYPTAVTLALLPLLARGLVDPDTLIADVKSGVSGAGRKAALGTAMGEVGEGFKAYAIDGHRHLPEIVQTLTEVAQRSVGLTFVPHLVPMIRGIEATVYARLLEDEIDLQQCYEQYYRQEPFVDVLAAGEIPETRHVRGTNRLQLAVYRPQAGRVAVISAVLDNLVKGAAGQAIQNLNLMYGFPETLGLNGIALLP